MNTKELLELLEGLCAEQQKRFLSAINMPEDAFYAKQYASEIGVGQRAALQTSYAVDLLNGIIKKIKFDK